jgi:hypothetical protein
VRGRQQHVERHHLVAGVGQPVDDLRSDEPGAAGDEYAHGRTLAGVALRP